MALLLLNKSRAKHGFEPVLEFYPTASIYIHTLGLNTRADPMHKRWLSHGAKGPTS